MDQDHSKDNFVTNKINNRDIYNLILELQQKQEIGFREMTLRQDKTNGNVKRNKLLIAGLWSAITVLMGVVGWMVATIYSPV